VERRRLRNQAKVDSLISRLRKKIEEKPHEHQLIRTVWGVGYKFEGAINSAPTRLHARTLTPRSVTRSFASSQSAASPASRAGR